MVNPELMKTVQFLREVGLAVDLSPGASGFLAGVQVQKGGLVIDPACPVSNLLHEAGHLAITPQRYRPMMDGNLAAGIRTMLEDLSARNLHPDSLEYRAAMQCSDPEATAWAWAAGKHLGIPDDLIIQDEEYDHTGAEIRLCLQSKGYLGINGLAHAGFCVVRESLSQHMGLPAYPGLGHWLQK